MSDSSHGTEFTDGVEPVLDPDMGNVEPSSPKRRPVSRVAALAACIALVAGLGGFLIGRSAGRSSDPKSSITAGAKESADASAASSPTGAATDENDSTEAPGFPTTIGPGNAKMAASSIGGGGGQYSPNAYPEPAQELVAERTTSTGITLRAHLQDFGAEGAMPYAGQFEGWKPAGWCFPTGQLRVSIITDSSANISFAPRYTDPKGGVAVSTFAGGYVEASPVFGAVVQVGTDVTSVTFATASGLSDTTVPTRGLALVAVNGPIEDSFTVTITQSDGATTNVTSADLASPNSNSEYHDACEPPPPVLPPAGTQPADPAAAEAAVRESWKISRDFGNTDSALRLSFIDDPTGINDAWKSLDDGQFGDVARTSTATIKDFVFTSPTEAWFRYDIVTSVTNFNDRYGMAHLGDDGVWRITRQTVCQDLSLAPGNQCTPAVDTLYPPSAAGDPRYGGGLDPGVIGIVEPAITPTAVGAPSK